MLPISRHLYLFPISPKPGHLSLLSVCSFVFADIFYINTKIIYNSADGLVYPSKLSGEVLCDTLRLVWCVCVRPPLCAPPMVSRYNLRTDFKFCTVVWYHKIQIKFELQCDQIIGSKVVTVWRLNICETWRGMKIQGKQFLICYTVMNF
jgi:hypothetical protein